MKPKLIVKGAAGRMGKTIISLAIEENFFSIAAAIEADGHADIGKDAGLTAGSDAINVRIGSEYPPDGDCMIDFSAPAAADAGVDYCVSNNVALVLCTTGLSAAQLEKIKTAGRSIPIIQATNMSVGMNILFRLAGKVASTLGEDYDIEIVESHHRFKKDAPSGSALTLAENIAVETGRPWPGCLVPGRNGKEALRKKGTIGVHAIRAGDITGRHSVIYGTAGETITLSHTAGSRNTFAIGALRAAKWLIGRDSGLYSMAEVLGLKQL